MSSTPSCARTTATGRRRVVARERDDGPWPGLPAPKPPQAAAGSTLTPATAPLSLPSRPRSRQGLRRTLLYTNVYDSRSDITLDDLRWGVGVGLVHQSRVGPMAFEVGWRDSGASLLSASLGWN